MGQPTHVDLRIRRTRRRLTEALIDLSSTQPVGSITVRDLTRHAQVGYATFFRHYGGIEDLMRGIVDELNLDLHHELRSSAGDSPVEPEPIIFRHVARNSGAYRLLLHADRSSGLLDRVVEVGTAQVLASFQPRPDASVPPDVATAHIISSVLGLIGWWLEHDMPHSPERMGEIFRRLVLDPVEAVSLEFQPMPKQ